MVKEGPVRYVVRIRPTQGTGKMADAAYVARTIRGGSGLTRRSQRGLELSCGRRPLVSAMVTMRWGEVLGANSRSCGRGCGRRMMLVIGDVAPERFRIALDGRCFHGACGNGNAPLATMTSAVAAARLDPPAMRGSCETLSGAPPRTIKCSLQPMCRSARGAGARSCYWWSASCSGNIAQPTLAH